MGGARVTWGDLQVPAFINRGATEGLSEVGVTLWRSVFILFTTGHPSDGTLCSPSRETLESSLAVIHSSSEAKGQAGYGDITQTPTGGGTVAAEPLHPRKQPVESCK